MCPKAEAEKKNLPNMVKKLQEDYHQVQEIVKEKHARNYVNLLKLYTRAEDVVLFFHDQPVQGVSKKTLP